MDLRIFFAGGLAFLLLFGCVGEREKAPSKPKIPSPQPGFGIGDEDLAVSEPSDDNHLLPEIQEIEAENLTTNTTSDSGSLESYVDVFQMNDSDLLLEVEGIEQ